MATIAQNSIICLEEPETHLHPIFQRKLLDYLAKKTTNQYFIATHSAHLLDIGMSDLGAAVFRVQLSGGSTVVEPITTADQRWRACKDLGYHASDIVQSNCVIWVEGPSDRIYIKHWIKTAAPELTEGIHYSVMFYGGSLLRHLTGVDDESNPDFDEFIALRRLNRNSAIIMDSDRSKKKEGLNRVKNEVIDEFKDQGFTWVTDGRTIENYLSTEILRSAFMSVHPHSGHKISTPGRFHTVTKRNAYFNKVAVAKAAAKQDADLTVLDLAKKIRELVEFIRKSNPNITPRVELVESSPTI